MLTHADVCSAGAVALVKEAAVQGWGGLELITGCAWQRHTQRMLVVGFQVPPRLYICVLINYYYICVLILLYICVLVLLYMCVLIRACSTCTLWCGTSRAAYADVC